MQGLSIIVGNRLLRPEKKQLMPLSNLPHHQFADTVFIGIVTGFVRVLDDLESPGILLWHFPGLASPGKRPLVLESCGNLLNSTKNMKCMEGSKEN